MEIGNTGRIIIKNTLWKFAERAGAQAVSLAVSIFLARIILPEQHGTIAIVNLFIVFFNVFVSFGLNTALIQKEDASREDFSTAYCMNLIIGICIYVLLFFLAPFLADFYEKSDLTIMLRVLGLQIPVMSVNTIQQAYISKTLQFKKFFYATSIGTVISAFAGIILAINGFGAWALVAQTMANTVIDTILLHVFTGLRFVLVFSKSSAKSLISFAFPLLISQILCSFYDELKGLIIGKKFRPADLVYYNKGQQFPMMVVINVDLSISSVIFASMSLEKGNVLKIREILSRTIQISTYIVFPLMIGMAAVADTMVKVLLTEAWIDCVPYIRIACFAYCVYGIISTTTKGILAAGASRANLQINIIHKMIMMPVLVIAVGHGVWAIAMTEILSYFLQLLIVSSMSRRYLKFSGMSIVRNCGMNFICSICMGVSVLLIGIKISWGNDLLKLIVQVSVGAAIYFFLSVFTGNKNLQLLKSFINLKRKIKTE